MRTIRFTKEIKFSIDGINSHMFYKDDEIELGVGQAETAVKGDFAVYALTNEQKKDAAEAEKIEKEVNEAAKKENVKKLKEAGLKVNKKLKGPKENK